MDLLADETPPYQFPCMIQSAEQDTLMVGSGTASSETVQQNLEFTDDQPGVDMEIPHALAHTNVDSSSNVELANFLKRPTRIHSFTWASGTSIIPTGIDPWTLYFNDTTIKKKLDNYAFMRANLKLKVVINASPFYYGAILFSYQPLKAFDPSFALPGGANELVPLSQRPNIWIYPQNSQGGTMTLPFIYHKQWAELASSEIDDLGELTYVSTGDLRFANSGVAGSVEVAVYAWAEDIQLAGPTVLNAMQSADQDEYSHKGILSKPASAIARATGMLSNIPIIGPYMTATSMVSRGVADLASLFGYTNVPVIDDVHFFKGTTIPHLASTDIGNPVEKLSLDAKNEVTIDPQVCGVTLDDELNIKKFCSRDSYLTSFEWITTDTIGDLLFNVRVVPTHTAVTVFPTFEEIQPLPMYMVASNFTYWRGEIIYRFKILASKYHKGRLEINWSPNGTPATAGNTTNQIYTKIVDIGDNSDVEFVVPYLQDSAYKRIAPSAGFTQYSSSTALSGGGVNDFAGSKNLCNGVLTVKVLNKQTAPVTTADITVLVYARCGESIEFAAPTNLDNNIVPYNIQSDEVDYDVNTNCINMGETPTSTDPNINLIYNGEAIQSIRTLINRSGYHRRCCLNSILATQATTLRSKFSRYPLYPGYDPNGINSADGLLSLLPEPYNYVNWHPLSWFQMCFIGSRGSVNWHVSPNYEKIYKLTIDRISDTRTVADYNILNQHPVLSSENERLASILDNSAQGPAGVSFTNPRTQTCVSACVPYYSRFKMYSNSIETRTLGTSYDDSDLDSVYATGEIVSSTAGAMQGMDIYVSGGPDFSLIFFLNCPTLYRMTTIPTPTP